MLNGSLGPGHVLAKNSALWLWDRRRDDNWILGDSSWPSSRSLDSILRLQSSSANQMAAGVLALLVTFVLMLISVSEVRAQETGIQRYQQTAGPYLISAAIVQSNLSLGKTLFAIDVVDSATWQPIPDVRVTILTRHLDGDHKGKGTAHNTPANRERYDAQMDLPDSGTWSITIEVDSSMGKVAVEMAQLEVPATRKISAGTFVFIGVFIVIIGGAAYLWWSTNRNRRGSGSSGNPGTGPGPS